LECPFGVAAPITLVVIGAIRRRQPRIWDSEAGGRNTENFEIGNYIERWCAALRELREWRASGLL
jgi:hypothetical protein